MSPSAGYRLPPILPQLRIPDRLRCKMHAGKVRRIYLGYLVLVRPVRERYFYASIRSRKPFTNTNHRLIQQPISIFSWICRAAGTQRHFLTPCSDAILHDDS